jgi:hypothetical protein
MARARNIKPALFKNEVLGVADPLLTLLFEGLWLLADREGRLEDRPLRVKGELFPYRDGLDIDSMLNWLAENGFIVRYQVGAKRYIEIDNFVKHQNPHKNEPESEIPCASDGCIAPEKIGTSTELIGSAPADSLSLDSPSSDSLIPQSPDSPPKAATDLFASFWKLYPNKVGKKDAAKAFTKLKVTQPLFDVIAQALANQAMSLAWRKDGGAFIPHPATWLNGERWKDEPPATNVHPLPVKSTHVGLSTVNHADNLERNNDGSYRI